jgi:hypothetical protein
MDTNSANPNRTVILFLGANPADTPRLRQDREAHAIDQALRRAEFRDQFELLSHWAARAADLQDLLQRHKPDIVHFSGHGSEAGHLIVEDDAGRKLAITPDALGRLFAILRDNLRCVVLNACYSEAQAQAIAEHIDCVIGMPDAIADAASIAFAEAFYQALANGHDVQTAFDLGCNQIGLKGLDESRKPTLWGRRCDPRDVVFARPSETPSPPSETPSPPQTSGRGNWFRRLSKRGKLLASAGACLALALLIFIMARILPLPFLPPPPPLQVTLLTDHGRYVTALPGDDADGRGWWLWADTPAIGAWEKFRLECVEDGKAILRTHHGRYVTATGPDEDWILTGAAVEIGDREQFTLYDAETKVPVTCRAALRDLRKKRVKLALQTADGWYVTAVNGEQDGQWILWGNAPEINSWEQFTVARP